MEEKMAYIYGDYLVELVKDGHHIVGEAFYPGEKSSVGKISCHFYNHNDPEDTSHTKDDSIHIDILRVQAGHDKKGIGTFLMKKLLSDYADKYKVKHVTTTPSPTGRISMANLRKFYLKFRFGNGFLSKKIEFVDEDNLLADVLEQSIEQPKTKNIVTESLGAFVSEKNNEPVNSNNNQSDKTVKYTKAYKVGYQTIIHFLDAALKSKNDIIQVGASGAEVYGLYLARKGHNVIVIEPDPDEAEVLRSKVDEVQRIKVVNDTYDSLEDYADDSMDAVLCFGPMYSSISFEAKQQILRESYRVCKSGGTVFVSFLMNEMMILDKTFNGDYDFISGPKFDSISLRAITPNRRLLSFDEIEVLYKLSKVRYSKRFAAEGVSLLIKDKMEGMNEKQFARWMDYHFKTCTKVETLGYSTHVIYITTKRDVPRSGTEGESHITK
ncbi:MAG: methyltransferase domain-containing protein [Lachnospiraceae bacterium]|nr:methyltransferase domain-containing protein [Lachnospiraceae bacterium]